MVCRLGVVIERVPSLLLVSFPLSVWFNVHMSEKVPGPIVIDRFLLHAMMLFMEYRGVI